MKDQRLKICRNEPTIENSSSHPQLISKLEFLEVICDLAYKGDYDVKIWCQNIIGQKNYKFSNYFNQLCIPIH